MWGARMQRYRCKQINGSRRRRRDETSIIQTRSEASWEETPSRDTSCHWNTNTRVHHYSD